MPRLIDADELIKDRVTNDPVVIAVKCAKTIGPESLRPHGKWIYDEKDECYICSNCEWSALNNYRGSSTDSNYCPNCGAKMGQQRGHRVSGYNKERAGYRAMKSILMSIQPKWCELIASKKKTIEVRKTKPKLPTPFKVYIYMTKSNLIGDKKAYKDRMAGKVIGEFVCDEIVPFGFSPYNHGEYILDNPACSYDILKESCLSLDEMFDYIGEGYGYGWHISVLKIYDKPKELSEFKKIKRDCWYADLGLAKRDCPDCQNPGCFLQRPPQSYCYVEEATSTI
ncbi:MAG: hypothetical protein J1F23_08795 [Oscillospiraceae bacterium]|nr:hypothetical protein [Oscillospiraceae bacterium]